MKRKLLLPIIFSQAINAQAWTANDKIDQTIDKTNTEISSINERLQELCGDSKAFSLEEAGKESNRLWKEIVNQVNNAKIKYGFDKSIALADRISVSVGKESISEAASNGKYLGIDKWRLGAGVGFLNTRFADLGLSATREVTFIQQFPSRCKSLVRLGYDPVTKIPLTAERAMNRLKPGDFIAFTSPLTLGLGKGLETFIERTDLTRSLGGFSIYASGEFNIHVYRMDNNYVRVRFFAAKTKGADLNPGLKFYALSGLIGIKLIEAELGTALTNLFSADYVFNLNDPQSREMYDRVMGEKFELKKVFGLTDAINPFAGDRTIQKTLFSDLTEIESASIADLSKSLESRRVIRLSQGETETFSRRSGIGFDLRIVKARHRTTVADSTVSFYDVTNEKQNYAIKTVSVQNLYNFFQLWGQEDNYNTAMLVKANERNEPVSLAGLQNIRVKEDLSLSKDDVRELRQRLKRLPEDITSILNLPDPDKLKGDIARARVEQSIFLDTQALEAQQSITFNSVKEELTRLILGWGKIDALPEGVNLNTTSDEMKEPRAEALEKVRLNLYWAKRAKTPEEVKEYMDIVNKNLLEAYSYELNKIPNFLSGLFGKEDIKTKLDYYLKLQDIPLFNEMGVTLVLNLISKADKAGISTVKMKDAVSYRLSITGRGIEPKITEYPVQEKNADGSDAISQNLQKSEIFQRILNDNAYITDRSFNLRYYMNEKGDSWSLKEIVARSTHSK